MTKAVTRKGHTASQVVSPLREFIFFAWDDATKSVVAGPARLDKPGSAPEALESGGRSVVRRDGRDVTINIAARPYMRPSLAKALKDLPGFWRGSIGG